MHKIQEIKIDLQKGLFAYHFAFIQYHIEQKPGTQTLHLNGLPYPRIRHLLVQGFSHNPEEGFLQF